MSETKQLPSWIKPNTADAYNHAYTVLYCSQPSDIRLMLDTYKADDSKGNRETREFMKEVMRMAQYEPSFEDLKALERREKAAGIHPSQHKIPPMPSTPITPSTKPDDKKESADGGGTENAS